MANFCIPPELIAQVKEAVKTGSSTVERQKQLTSILGKQQADEFNLAFEKSRLLKNTDAGLEKVLKGFTTLGQADKVAFRKSIADRLVARKDKIHQEELLAIAQEIWQRKYKVHIPIEVTEKINKLKIQLDDLTIKMEGTPFRSPERLARGKVQTEIKYIVDGVKNPTDALNIVDTVKQILKDTQGRFTNKSMFDKGVEGLRLAYDVLTSAVYKSVQAAADLSYGLRQGFKVLATNPTVWKHNWVKAFEPFQKLASKEAQQVVYDDWMAGIITHPLYDVMVKSKLALSVTEDFFPTTLAEKIPALGNVFKASNQAFTIFSQGSRVGLFEDMYNKALQNGTEMTPEFLHDIAKLANSTTGRGSLGKYESVSGSINKLFFSGRYIKSAIDTFTLPFTLEDSFARAEAQKASLRVFGLIGSLMYSASLFTEVEFDPRSTRFGKMKVIGSDDTWVDLTAGIGSYVLTAAKFATVSTKNAKTGKIQELNKRDSKGNLVYGGETVFDVGVNWFTGKLSPAPNTMVQFAKGRTYEGEKPTIAGAAQNLVTPITAGNAFKTIMTDETELVKLISVVADINGLSTTNYSK